MCVHVYWTFYAVFMFCVFMTVSNKNCGKWEVQLLFWFGFVLARKISCDRVMLPNSDVIEGSWLPVTQAASANQNITIDDLRENPKSGCHVFFRN